MDFFSSLNRIFRTFAPMITTQDIIQLRAFARQDGFLTALLWTASFAAMMYTPETPIGQLLMFATPFFVGWRLTAFRNDALEGVISYRRAYAFSLHVFFYSALVFALVQYLYFRYLDGGRFIMQLTQGMDILRQLYSSQGEMSAETGDMLSQMEQSLEDIRSSSPIDLTFVFMMMNLWAGFFLSFLIAAFGQKKVKK